MKNRFLALLLALVLVVGLLPAGTLLVGAAETPSAWDGNTVTEPKKVDGVYQIGTAEELAWFGKQTQKYGDANRTLKAELTADIDLGNQNWLSYMIGDSGSYAYAGTFEGNGHSITGFRLYKNFAKKPSLTQYMGLFSCTAVATIRNLNLEGTVEIDMNGATEKITGYYVAGLVAQAKGTTIENVVVNVNVTLTNNENKYGSGTTGGLAARVSFNSVAGATTSDPRVITDSLVQNCENLGNVTGGSTTGGLVATSANCVTIRNCKNSGDVYSVNGYAGGIVGSVSGTTVENCANTGNLSGASSAAGIAASFSYSASTNAENPGVWVAVMRNCYNTGEVTGRGENTANTYYAAGLAGSCYGYIKIGDSSQNQYNIVENCYNAGQIKLGPENTKAKAAGALGSTSYTKAANTYYMEGTSEVGCTTDATAKDIGVKTEAEMKSKDFVGTMGSAFKARSGGFPALTWEKIQGIMDITVTVNGENAVLHILDGDKNEVAPNEDGTYGLETGKTYTYTAQAPGYVTTTGEISNVENLEEGIFRITMEKAVSHPKDLDAQWPSFRGNDENMAITKAATPTGEENSELLWAAKLGSGWANAPGSPILVDGCIYVQAGTGIYKMDRDTGAILAQGTMVESSGFSVIPPTYGAGMIFVPQGSGRVQAFDANTLESLWTYKDALGGQSLSSIAYDDGCIYVGYWNSETKNANFVCLTVDDEDPTQTNEAKLPLWTYTQTGGFYWAGAYVHGDYVLVGTDDGLSGYSSATANLLVFNKHNGELVSSKTGYVGDIRSNVAYDEATDRVYFTSKGGWFYSEQIDWSTGEILEDASKAVELGGMSTSTPVVYNGRAYVGVSGTSQFGADSGHNVAVIDLDTWEIAYRAYLNGYPQTSGLLSTAHVDEDGYVYVYFCANYTPGGIYVIKDKPGVTEVLDGTEKNGKTYAPLVFNPQSPLSQYCICSPIAGEDGTLYYKNDSAYIMAVSSKSLGLTVENHEAAKDGVYDDAKIEAYVELTNGQRRKVSVTTGKDEEGNWIASYTYGLSAGSYSKTTLTAPLHSYNGWEIESEATCDHTGLMTKTCAYCGEKLTRTIPTLNHQWDEGTVTTPATCTAEGEMTYTCATCSETKVEPIAKIPHDYEVVVTPATCEAMGYTTHTCKACQDSYVDNVQSALGHDWNQGEVTKAATCTEEGVMTYTCTRCSATRVEAIVKTAHSYEVVVTAPTCQAIGYSTYTCSVCGDTYMDDIVPVLEHDYKAVVTEPTCDKMGYTTYTCDRCGSAYVDNFTAALEHDYKAVVTEPTCDKMGYTTYTCDRCGSAYVDNFTAALEHDFTQTVTKEATCTAEGELTFTCTHEGCGVTYTQAIPKADHELAEEKTEATCTAYGYTTFSCKNCNYSYIAEIVQPKGHTWDEGKTLLEANCLHEGMVEYTCSLCAETKIENAAKTDHKWDEGVITKEPTAYAEGEKTYTCSVCGETKTETVAKLNACDGGKTCPSGKFTDVDTALWYHEAVDYAVVNGLFAGTSDTTFSPNQAMTRGMMVTVLWRLAGEPEAKNAAAFEDVTADQYFAKAVAWASENGIVTGTSDTTFSPETNITREQMAAILYRYAKFCNVDLSKTADLEGFPDGEQVSVYAKEALAWAVENGIINGSIEGGKTYLDPQGEATRAQVASILMRYAKSFN